MAVLVYLVVLLALTGHSSALYCLCKDGVADTSLQKSLDYACGAGADCTQILQNGACYQPNTVKSHCDYAVNSYYQRKGQVNGSCDFSGTATTSATLPTTVATACVYPASPSNTGSTTTTPSTTPTSTAPGTSTTTPGTSTTTPTTTPTTTSSATPTVFGLGPTGSGADSSDGVALFNKRTTTNLFFACMALWLSGLFLLWGSCP